MGLLKHVQNNSIGIIMWVGRQLFLLFSMCHFGPYSLIYKLVQFFTLIFAVFLKARRRDKQCRHILVGWGVVFNYSVCSIWLRFQDISDFCQPEMELCRFLR